MEYFITSKPIDKYGIVLDRISGGSNVQTNVPRLIPRRLTDSTGYGWGRNDAWCCCLDLGLNVVEVCLTSMHYRGPIRRIDNVDVMFMASWYMCTAFTTKYIIHCPHEGGELDWDIVMDWVTIHTPNYSVLRNCE